MVDDARAIITAVTASGIVLTGPAGTGSPRAELGGIRLNGDLTRGQSYESFIVWAPSPDTASASASASASARRPVDFCKTAQRPYDLAVCAVLLRCHLLLPGEFLIASDGNWHTDWTRARHLVADLFGPVPETDPLSRDL